MVGLPQPKVHSFLDEAQIPVVSGVKHRSVKTFVDLRVTGNEHT